MTNQCLLLKFPLLTMPIKTKIFQDFLNVQFATNILEILVAIYKSFIENLEKLFLRTYFSK